MPRLVEWKTFRMFSSPHIGGNEFRDPRTTRRCHMNCIMNICMLTRAMPSHFKGGVQDHTAMLAGGLAASGHTVTILTTAHADGRSVEQSGNCTVRYLAGTSPGKLNNSWWKESSQAAMQLHRERSFDIVHAQGAAGCSVISGNGSRLAGPATVVSQHGTTWDELVTRSRRGFSVNPVRTLKNILTILYVSRNIIVRDMPYLRAADGVIATSREQQALLSRIYGISQERLFTVFNGMDLQHFTPGPKDPVVMKTLGAGASTKVILCVARLIRDKGIQYMLRAMPAILKVHPDCRLLILGDGNYRGGLGKLSRQLHLEDSVRFVGSVTFEQLPGYFRLCDLFVNPTVQQNGYDLTNVEAMACERVVVSSRIGSTPTLIRDGVDGILFEPANVTALADRVNHLLSNPSLRLDIGQRARRKAIAEFTLETMVRKTEQVYESLVARRASTPVVVR